MSTSNKIAIAITIKLKNRREIASALLNRYGTDYLFIGRMFKETTTDKNCQISISSILNDNLEHIKSIKRLRSKKQDKTLLSSTQNTNHSQQIIYLTSTKVGYEACLTMARFTQVFLNIGGVAVNIESAGVAHGLDKWRANHNSDDVFDIYSLYVGLVEGENNYYSCGMHNFGKADVSIDITEDISLAIYVMNVFNYYRLTESPILQDGHTFQPDIESPRYQMKLVEDEEYEINSLQHNYWGRWHLKRH